MKFAIGTCGSIPSAGTVRLGKKSSKSFWLVISLNLNKFFVIISFYLISLTFLSQGISNGSHQLLHSMNWVQQGLSGKQLQPKKLQLGGWPLHSLYIPIQYMVWRFKEIFSYIQHGVLCPAKQKFLMLSLIVLAYMCHKVYSNKNW